MRTKQQAGFTLVEILVVTAIIGILIGIVLGISGIASKKSDESKARADMQKISNALEEYNIHLGGYPTTFTGPLNSTDLDASVIRHWLTNSLPNRTIDLKFTDPWGRGYVYTNATKTTFTLYSDGVKPNDVNSRIVSGSY